MSRIPCKCDGNTFAKCKSSSHNKGTSDDLLASTQTSTVKRLLNRGGDEIKHYPVFDLKQESVTSVRRFLNRSDGTGTNLIKKTFGDFYEKCAGYNLRYCSITGFVKHNEKYFRHIIRDVVVLICFFATNFVIFLAVMCKIIVHTLLFVLITLKSIVRTVLSNSSAVGEIFSWPPGCSSQQFLMKPTSKMGEDRPLSTPNPEGSGCEITNT